MLIQAAMLPFRRVIGVELSPQLTERARHNLSAIAGRQRCQSVELYTADARAYPIPDDVNYLYTYNPFTGSAFEHVVGNITASLARRPRPFTIIYSYPREEATLLAHGATLVRECTHWRPAREWKHRFSRDCC